MALVEFDDCRNGLGILTLNSPDSRNAMCEEMAEEMQSLVYALSQMPQVRVIIITGSGSAFSSGGDFDMLLRKSELSGEVNRTRMVRFYESFLGIRKINIPLIAAINGHAIGAGAALACGMDIRVASSNAILGFTFARLGLFPGMGSTFFLKKLVGDSVAAELLLTGRIIDAIEAQRLGLISRVVSEGEDVVEVARRIAGEILSSGPQTIKQLITGFRNDDYLLERSLDRESLCQVVSYASDEFREGVAAVREKRVPDFANLQTYRMNGKPVLSE